MMDTRPRQNPRIHSPSTDTLRYTWRIIQKQYNIIIIQTINTRFIYIIEIVVFVGGYIFVLGNRIISHRVHIKVKSIFNDIIAFYRMYARHINIKYIIITFSLEE